MLKRIYAFLLAAVWALALAGCALGALGAGFGLWWYGRKDIAP